MVRVREVFKKVAAKVSNRFFSYDVVIEKYSLIERMTMSLARGTLNRSSLKIVNTSPITWEFSSFSQSGGDGIIDFLTSHIREPNRYFVEIGSSNGLENNSSYLAFARKYSGLMIEGNLSKSRSAKKHLGRFNWGVNYINTFVTRENIGPLLEKESLYPNPDFFSLDIDGIDYYVMEAVMNSGFRPKVICVEYNSTYGPSQEITIKYKADFNYWRAHPTHFYFGVSVNGWKSFFKKFNYEFVTVDSNGVDAFFIDRRELNDDFPKNVAGLDFRENFEHRCRLKNTWVDQFEMIKDLDFYHIK
jgi:hypothetical protein